VDQQLPDQQEVDGDQVIKKQLEDRRQKGQAERTVVLRVYNYFRIVLSFFLLILFFEVPDQTFVGNLEPRWFQLIMLIYLAFNVATGIIALVAENERFNGPSAISSVVILDIFFLSLLLLTSGGIESGLGYLLVFSVAFGSVMLGGQISVVFAAIAAVNTLSSELYLANTGAVETNQHFFEVAMIGVSFFVVNFFFQYVRRLVEDREEEVVSLEALNEMHRFAEQSRHELEISNARFVALLESTGEGVLVLDLDGIVTFANPRSCQYLEIPHEELVGSNIQRFLVINADLDEESRRPQRILKMLEIETGQHYDPNRWQTGARESFVVNYSCELTKPVDGEHTGALVLFRNITEQWENEERIQYLANYDELTGLANRTNFKEVLRSAMSRIIRSGRSLAILIIDTDHFTVINEQLGESVGDDLLKLIANRLDETIRDGDLVARLAGDQFAVMLVDLDRAENAAIVAEKVNQLLGQTFNVNGFDINTSVSIGIAVLGPEHRDGEELLNAALSAVGTAKEAGRNTYRFYQAEMQNKADEKRRIQIMLRTAVENNEFQLYYQPIVNIQLGKIESSEALIRWMPADADPVRPDIFIPIAEESGQINTIGSWVLETVSTQVTNWKEQLGEYPNIAINVSSKQLRDHQFREQFEGILISHRLPVEVVEMELTETGVMEDPETSLKELTLLRDLGVKISIDDFGTGYSSLDYLRRLPLDILKIDQSFTRGIGESDNDEEIVRVMIRMAHAMGLKVICEGVETKDQLQFLLDHDCDLCQGYYFSRPRDVDSITDLFMAEKLGTVNIMDGT